MCYYIYASNPEETPASNSVAPPSAPPLHAGSVWLALAHAKEMRHRLRGRFADHADATNRTAQDRCRDAVELDHSMCRSRGWKGRGKARSCSVDYQCFKYE